MFQITVTVSTQKKSHLQQWQRQCLYTQSTKSLTFDSDKGIQRVSPSTVIKAVHSAVPAQLVATQVYFPSWLILALLIFSVTLSSSCNVFMLGVVTRSCPFLYNEVLMPGQPFPLHQCVHDQSYAGIYTQELGTPATSQHNILTRKNSHIFFIVLRTGFQPLVFEFQVDALPIEPPHHPVNRCSHTPHSDMYSSLSNTYPGEGANP